METTLGGKMYMDIHTETTIKDQSAWRGTYTFPSNGITDPATNDRVLFKWKGIYTDITLSYSQSLDQGTKDKCQNDFKSFLEAIELK